MQNDVRGGALGSVQSGVQDDQRGLNMAQPTRPTHYQPLGSPIWQQTRQWAGGQAPAAPLWLFWLSAGLAALAALAGAAAALHLALSGHHLSGMGTQLVWGIPHVFALTLILAGAGALVVAASGQLTATTPLAATTRLGSIVASALLIGGLAVLVFDLGRPDQLPVTFQHFNPASSFARNIFFYLGFFAIVGLLLWSLLDPALARYRRLIGWLALIWPLLLATNVGSIFALLAAHEGFRSGLLFPLFVSAALAYGSAVLLLGWLAANGLTPAVTARGANARGTISSPVMAPHVATPPTATHPTTKRLSRLLALFLAAHAAVLLVHLLSLLYSPAARDVARFLLIDGGIYPVLFWFGMVAVGVILPSLLLLAGVIRQRTSHFAVAAGLVLLGGLAHLFVMVVGVQAHPVALIPGYEVTGAAFDGEVFSYQPTLWEWLIGLSGVAIAWLTALVAVGVLPLTPRPAAATRGSSAPDTLDTPDTPASQSATDPVD
ncbi:hypothetical protein CKO15_12980 [Halorhodospira abdelmalekii]|nr:hypothetical protein [Halorhodospira abdelmalekii]